MAKRKFYFDEHGEVQGLPFPFPFSKDDFESEDDLAETLRVYWDEYDQTVSELRPGEPNPFVYPGREENERYKSDARIYELTNALSAAMRQNAPRPKPEIDLDFMALSSWEPKDRAKGKERLEDRVFIKEQSRIAENARASGDLTRARAAEERIQMTIRQAEKDSQYAFQKFDNANALEAADRELEQIEKLPPAEQAAIINGNLPHYRSLVACRNHESDSDSSFLVDERNPNRPVLRQVTHLGEKSSYLAQVAGGKEKVDYLMTLSYPETVEEAEAREIREIEAMPAEQPKDPYESMSQKDFEAKREREGAKPF